jgi:hypothetical protein
MTTLHINISTVDGKTSVCFDTGLDPRAFARTKMSQSLIETGVVSFPDGSRETWKPAGVNEINGLMRVWGPLFASQRLDLLLEKTTQSIQTTSKQAAQQAALQAVAFWIRAKMLLGDTRSASNPAAAFVCFEDGETPGQKRGAVFFAPEHISNRCLITEGTQTDRYNCPDLTGMESAAFCAALMLYIILTGAHPYPEETIYQDMREGIFLPPSLAAAGLDKKMSELIMAGLLLPVEKKRTAKSGSDILAGFLEILLDRENRVTDVSSFLNALTAEENARFEKERKGYLFRQNTIVKTRRFAAQNKYILIGIAVGLLFTLFIIFSMTKSFSHRLTTAGMASDTVIIAYYDAFSSLNHVFMEACVMGADKTDINAAASLYAVTRTREAYERTNTSLIIPARIWKENGGELPAPNVFGVTDLDITYLAGSEEANMILYRTEYLLWSPSEDYPIKRSDVITLARDRKKNWRITEILRTEF